MAITVYWACTEPEWMRATEPESVYKEFSKLDKTINNDISFCPSVKEYINNTFALRSLYDYEFEIDHNDNTVKSNLYTQDFFDAHVFVRRMEDKSFSFKQEFVFFTEEESLLMSAGIFPYLEDNNITERCTVIPGRVDIGKWFRIMDFAFFLKNKYSSFQIKEKEIFQYIKFDTEEKIVFKQFVANDLLKKYARDIDSSKLFRKRKSARLIDHYSLMKHKKLILKEIKNNLI